MIKRIYVLNACVLADYTEVYQDTFLGNSWEECFEKACFRYKEEYSAVFLEENLIDKDLNFNRSSSWEDLFKDLVSSLNYASDFFFTIKNEVGVHLETGEIYYPSEIPCNTKQFIEFLKE